MHKQKKISNKITAILSIILLLAFTAFTAVVTIVSGTEIAGRQESELLVLSQANAKTAKEFMEKMIYKQEVLGAAVQNLGGMEQKNRLPFSRSLFSQALAEEKDAISLFFISPKTGTAPEGVTVYATPGGSGIEQSQELLLDREDYASLEEKRKLEIKDPHGKTIDGKEYMVITVLQPLLDSEGSLIGVVGCDIDTEMLNGAEYEDGAYGSFENMIICGHQTVIIDKAEPSNIGSGFADTSRSTEPSRYLEVAENAREELFLTKYKNGNEYYSSCVPFYIGDSRTVWLSVTSVSAREFTAPVARQTVITVLFCLAVLILVVLVIRKVLQRQMKPMQEIEKAAEGLRQGNLSIPIAYSGNDEIGRLAENMRMSMATLKCYVDDIAMILSCFADGNFVIPEPRMPFVGEFQVIETDVRLFVGRISETLRNINLSADQVAGGAEQISCAAQSLSQGATEQACTAQELASAITDISTHFNHTAENALTAKDKSETAGKAVMESNVQMGQMLEAMNAISGKSKEIGNIVKNIEDIAFQTNLLALNAALEAARAGMAGKGFAVVAEEVRELAGKSAEAAKSTILLIEETVSAVENGSRMANVTAEKMEDVIQYAGEAVRLIVNIASEAGEQASNVDQVRIGVSQISAVIQNNSAASQESAAASEELSAQAHLLNTLVGQFRLKEEP